MAASSFLFFSPPAMGEMQPTLAVAEALLRRDPQCQIYIASGSSFEKKFDDFKSSLADELMKNRISRVDLGSTDDVEDYSRHMLKVSAIHSKSSNDEDDDDDDASSDPSSPSSIRRLYGTHRHARGNPIPFFDFWEAFASGSELQRLATIQRVLGIVDAIKPDMIIVDQIYGTPFDAVRYSKLPFVLLAPGHPSFAADVNPLLEPLSMSGLQWRNSFSDILHNFKLIYKLLSWTLRSNWAQTTLKLRRWTLGFKWLSIGADLTITPPPAAVQEVCAAIMCNVQNLDFYKSWPDKCHFVGMCTRTVPSNIPPSSDVDELTAWLDDAYQNDEKIIFISFGSMFPFTQEDYDSMHLALLSCRRQYSGFRVLWKIAGSEGLKRQTSPIVRETKWLPDIEMVYKHPATSVVIHHGGGNTVNEVIYHGLLHLVIPQWSDTYDWGATISAFGLGEQVENEGPQLDATEIARQLLKLLEFPEVYKHRIQYWQNRARESLGPDGGAAVILSEAGKQADRYKEVYSFPGRLKTRFNMEPSEGFL